MPVYLRSRHGYGAQYSMPPKPKPPPLLDVFFDIEIDGQAAGRITFHLFDDVTPKTAANFRALSCGHRADGESLPEAWSYTGVPFHRIIPGFMAQGGDFEKGDGSGGRCIYERKKFKDENMRLKHDKPGLLSMANAGKDTNGSQFFITFKELPQLNRKHVVFGEVTSGMEVVERVEQLGSKTGAVSAKVIIAACGTIPLDETTV